MHSQGPFQLFQNRCVYLEEAMDELEREEGDNGWAALDAEAHWENSMRRSLEHVEQNLGWGIVAAWEGELVASCHS